MNEHYILSDADGFFEPVEEIGGNQGDPFAFIGGTDGRLVKKIGVWAGPWQIKAIRVWIDDEDRKFGITDGDHDSLYPYQEFEFDVAAGERITRMSLWGNGEGTRAGWIRFTTSRGREFDHGMTEWDKKQEYPINVGDGLLVGVQGAAGSDVDRLGFIFLKPIKDVRLDVTNYPSLEDQVYREGIRALTLDEYKDVNNDDAERNYNFGGDLTEEESSAWSVSASVEYHSQVTVSAGIPEIGTVEGEAGWKISLTGTYGQTYTKSRKLSWSESGKLQPGDSIRLRAMTNRGQIRVEYDGEVTVSLKNGKRFTFETRGTYDGVGYTSINVVSDDELAIEDRAPGLVIGTSTARQ